MQTAPTSPLIPTSYKLKIAHTHSYPIGAEAISRALAGVPQFDHLELTFWDYKFQPLATSYEVFGITYRKPDHFYSASKDMIERGYFEEKWAITIKPVPRGQRHAIQADLLGRSAICETVAFGEYERRSQRDRKDDLLLVRRGAETRL